MLIRKTPILALAAITCFLTTGGGSPGGMTQPMPASPGGGQVSEPEDQEHKPYEDDDLSVEAEEWRAQNGKTSPRPVSTTTEGESGGASAISAGLEQGKTEEELKEEEKMSPEEREKKQLEPAPTHFGHRLQQQD